MEKFKRLESFNDSNQQILESIEAFYLGLDTVAITSLLPCIENVIRKLDKKHPSKKVKIDRTYLLDIIKSVEKNYINQVFYRRFDWVPTEFKSVEFLDKIDERIVCFQSLIYYIDKKLYAHTDSYDGESKLNRHSVLHGFSTEFSTPDNFYRMLNFLNSLAFCASFEENISISIRPSNTNEQILLREHLGMLNNIGLIRRKNLLEIGVEP